MNHIFSHRLFHWAMPLMILIFATSCGGAGNTPTQNPRVLKGQIASASSIPPIKHSMRSAISGAVGVDGLTITATTKDGTQTTTTDANGHFTLEGLEVGKTYLLTFSKGGVDLGTLIFKSGGMDAKGLKVTVGNGGDIDIGLVDCVDGECKSEDPTKQASCQVDGNNDGQADCENSDDGDKHNDSNLDGNIDDDQEGANQHAPSTTDCEVRRVESFDGEMGVDLDETIKIRFSNALDPNKTIDSSMIKLTGPLGVVDVTVKIEDHQNDGKEVHLKPNKLLDPSTEYTIDVSKTIKCANGASPIKAVHTKFTTDEGQHSGVNHP